MVAPAFPFSTISALLRDGNDKLALQCSAKFADKHDSPAAWVITSALCHRLGYRDVAQRVDAIAGEKVGAMVDSTRPMLVAGWMRMAGLGDELDPKSPVPLMMPPPPIELPAARGVAQTEMALI